MVDSLDNTTAATQASPPAPNAPARPKRSGAVFKHMWQDVLGVATTLVAGLSGAGWSVDASFWKNAKEKKDGFIGPLSKDRDDERRKIFKDLTTEIEKKPSPEALEKLATATRTSLATIEKDYKAAKTSLLKNMHLDTALRRFGTLRVHQKQEAVTAGIATAAVALGVITSLAAFQRSGNVQEDLEADLAKRDGQTR